MTKKQHKAPVLHRVATVDPTSIDVENRTMRLAFASELPYQRHFGYEILNISPESIRTEYLDARAAFLVQHNWDDLIGAVIEYSIDDDRVARATVKIGRSERAEMFFQDFIDQIRTQISVGYMVNKMEACEPIDGVPAFKVVDFTPFEISTVTIAADPVGSGVGRALTTRDATIEVADIDDMIAAIAARAAEDMAADDTTEEKAEEDTTEAATDDTAEDKGADDAPAEDTPAEETEAKEADGEEDTAATTEEKAEEEEATEDKPDGDGDTDDQETRAAHVSVQMNDPALAAEQLRVHTLQLLGKQLKAETIASDCISRGLDVEAFKQLVVQSKSSKGNNMEIGLSTKETRKFSFLRALHAQTTGDWSQAQFEREATLAAAKLMNGRGLAVQGMAIPAEVLKRSNPMTAGVAANGGNLIQSDVVGSSFIELLYSALILNELGCTVLEASNPFALPRAVKGSGATASGVALWNTETGVANSGQVTFEQEHFTPRRLAYTTQLGKLLLAESSVDVESMVIADLAKAMALGIQNGAINGDGTNNTPNGILARLPAGQKVTFAGAAPTRAEVIQLESLVADQNINGNAFLVSPITRGTLKSTPIAANYPAFLMDGNEMVGYKVAVSKVIANGGVLFGDFSNLVVSYFNGGLDLVADPFSFAKQGIVEITGAMFADVGVRHLEGFAYGKAA